MNTILIIILISILMIIAWAIFSSKTEAIPEIIKTPTDQTQSDEPEKILRRRSADRAIEKEYPAEKFDAENTSEILHEREDSSGQIQLPFPANDIITDGSRFKLYKRALINSEIYAKRGDIETAVSLFKGVKERILDSDIRSKIESNINYLNHFRHRRDEDFKKKIESAYSGQQSPELRVKIDGQVPQTINIAIPEKNFINTEEIIQKLSEQITKELGTVKDDIESLKTKPEEKFDLDDYAEFSNLQHEFNNLKLRFEELTQERVSTVNELNRLREFHEDRLESDKLKNNIPENNEILKEIRKEIDNLSGLKHSLDSLHNKIEDITAIKIPESISRPSIIQAKYESPIPIHFDPKPVLELLDRINQQKKEEKPETVTRVEKIYETKSPEHIIPEEETGTIAVKPGDIDSAAEKPEIIESPDEKIPESIHEQDHAEDLFPSAEIHPREELKPDTINEVPEEFSLDDLTTLEAEEFLNETAPEVYEELPPDETLFEEPETRYEKPVHAEPEKVTEKTEPASERKKSDDTPAEQKFKSEKEKEIEKHIDAEEDPNAFDLVSEIGKVKDDSTLSDEDIFEKILKDDKNRNDDSAFEILGDTHKEDQEISIHDSNIDGRMKAEQDFYKKFIKADRIKKRELPILKVSYDFKKLPDEFSLSREKNILEYSFYKYKPMLEKADEYIKHRHVKDAINYYKVVLDQNIPVEFKAMIKKNIRDLTEYLEKYLSSE